jgi:hypothetical protein
VMTCPTSEEASLVESKWTVVGDASSTKNQWRQNFVSLSSCAHPFCRILGSTSNHKKINEGDFVLQDMSFLGPRVVKIMVAFCIGHRRAKFFHCASGCKRDDSTVATWRQETISSLFWPSIRVFPIKSNRPPACTARDFHLGSVAQRRSTNKSSISSTLFVFLLDCCVTVGSNQKGGSVSGQFQERTEAFRSMHGRRCLQRSMDRVINCESHFIIRPSFVPFFTPHLSWTDCEWKLVSLQVVHIGWNGLAFCSTGSDARSPFTSHSELWPMQARAPRDE